MDLDDAVRACVLLDLEREPMGFYEVLLAANTLFPDERASDRLAAAERVVVGLVEDGLVSVWRGPWNSHDAERTPVAGSDVDRILRSAATWYPRDDPTIVWMALRSGDPTSTLPAMTPTVTPWPTTTSPESASRRMRWGRKRAEEKARKG